MEDKLFFLFSDAYNSYDEKIVNVKTENGEYGLYINNNGVFELKDEDGKLFASSTVTQGFCASDEYPDAVKVYYDDDLNVLKYQVKSNNESTYEIKLNEQTGSLVKKPFELASSKDSVKEYSQQQFDKFEFKEEKYSGEEDEPTTTAPEDPGSPAETTITTTDADPKAQETTENADSQDSDNENTVPGTVVVVGEDSIESSGTTATVAVTTKDAGNSGGSHAGKIVLPIVIGGIVIGAAVLVSKLRNKDKHPAYGATPSKNQNTDSFGGRAATVLHPGTMNAGHNSMESVSERPRRDSGGKNSALTQAKVQKLLTTLNFSDISYENGSKPRINDSAIYLYPYQNGQSAFYLRAYQKKPVNYYSNQEDESKPSVHYQIRQKNRVINFTTDEDLSYSESQTAHLIREYFCFSDDPERWFPLVWDEAGLLLICVKMELSDPNTRSLKASVLALHTLANVSQKNQQLKEFLGFILRIMKDAGFVLPESERPTVRNILESLLTQTAKWEKIGGTDCSQIISRMDMSKLKNTDAPDKELLEAMCNMLELHLQWLNDNLRSDNRQKEKLSTTLNKLSEKLKYDELPTLGQSEATSNAASVHGPSDQDLVKKLAITRLCSVDVERITNTDDLRKIIDAANEALKIDRQKGYSLYNSEWDKVCDIIRQKKSICERRLEELQTYDAGQTAQTYTAAEIRQEINELSKEIPVFETMNAAKIQECMEKREKLETKLLESEKMLPDFNELYIKLINVSEALDKRQLSAKEEQIKADSISEEVKKLQENVKLLSSGADSSYIDQLKKRASDLKKGVLKYKEQLENWTDLCKQLNAVNATLQSYLMNSIYSDSANEANEARTERVVEVPSVPRRSETLNTSEHPSASRPAARIPSPEADPNLIHLNNPSEAAKYIQEMREQVKFFTFSTGLGDGFIRSIPPKNRRKAEFVSIGKLLYPNPLFNGDYYNLVMTQKRMFSELFEISVQQSKLQIKRGAELVISDTVVKTDIRSKGMIII